jgi:ABC-type Fe3+ transport system permease subunit
MKLRAVARALLIAAALAVTAAPAAAQCSMCKTALTSSPEGRGLAGHLNHAILMLVFAPYAVTGTVAGVLFRRQIAARLARLLRRPR